MTIFWDLLAYFFFLIALDCLSTTGAIWAVVFCFLVILSFVSIYFWMSSTVAVALVRIVLFIGGTTSSSSEDSASIMMSFFASSAAISSAVRTIDVYLDLIACSERCLRNTLQAARPPLAILKLRKSIMSGFAICGKTALGLLGSTKAFSFL